MKQTDEDLTKKNGWSLGDFSEGASQSKNVKTPESFGVNEHNQTVMNPYVS